MTDPMTPERLAEIEQRRASGRIINTVERDLIAEVRRLQAAAERVRALHRPGSYSAGMGSLTWWDVCPTCGDKAGVHPCGCWRDVDEKHICKECSVPGRVSEPWPCPTIAALDGPHE